MLHDAHVVTLLHSTNNLSSECSLQFAHSKLFNSACPQCGIKTNAMPSEWRLVTRSSAEAAEGVVISDVVRLVPHTDSAGQQEVVLACSAARTELLFVWQSAGSGCTDDMSDAVCNMEAIVWLVADTAVCEDGEAVTGAREEDGVSGSAAESRDVGATTARVLMLEL